MELANLNTFCDDAKAKLSGKHVTTVGKKLNGEKLTLTKVTLFSSFQINLEAF